MKAMAERLIDQIDASKKFTEENFGLQVGDGFPELVRELTGNERLATKLLMAYVTTQMQAERVATVALEAMAGGDRMKVARMPGVYEVPLTWMYWGIEIGRQLERESSESKVTA